MTVVTNTTRVTPAVSWWVDPAKTAVPGALRKQPPGVAQHLVRGAEQ